MHTIEAGPKRLAGSPRAFATRRVPVSAMAGLVTSAAPRPGDLVLARVDRLGHHKRLQLPGGSRRHLFEGDEILLAYGDRYAPRQFEAIVPKSLDPCHLVAGGGIAANALSWHSRIARGPTAITPLGLVADSNGRPLNLADFSLPDGRDLGSQRPVTVVVLGTSMDAGKSTMAAFLARGLVRAGLRPGFAKLTGTGAGGDLWLAADAGAHPVVDFTDAGFASTYRVPPLEIERIATTLVTHVADVGVDVVIVEVADGLLQPETAALLRANWFLDLADAALFAAPDALGALAGVQLLRGRGLPVLGVGGRLTTSPLQCREAVLATGIPAMGSTDLADPATARKLVEEAREGRRRA